MQGITAACDIWSLGCTIIELVTGLPPYFHLNTAQALYKYNNLLFIIILLYYYDIFYLFILFIYFRIYILLLL